MMTATTYWSESLEEEVDLEIFTEDEIKNLKETDELYVRLRNENEKNLELEKKELETKDGLAAYFRERVNNKDDADAIAQAFMIMADYDFESIPNTEQAEAVAVVSRFGESNPELAKLLFENGIDPEAVKSLPETTINDAGVVKKTEWVMPNGDCVPESTYKQYVNDALAEQAAEISRLTRELEDSQNQVASLTAKKPTSSRKPTAAAVPK